jgi:hypothetical protein
VKGQAVTKTSQSQQPQRTSIQPWLSDRYAALRAETGPRWQHTRAVVVPVLADTSHRVRHELMPAAAQLSSRVAEEAKHRSAPLRAEVSDRASATLAAARGQVTAAQIEHLNRRHPHRKFWFLSGVAAAGAALGTAAVFWQRSRYHAWAEDEAMQNDADFDANPERLDTTNPDEASSHEHNGTAPDSGTDAHASGRHSSKHH